MKLVFIVLAFIAPSWKVWALPYSSNLLEDPAVTNLRTFLRFNTAHPTPEAGYLQSIEWIRQQADEIGLDFNLLGLGQDGVPHAFALWLTWNGTNPALKSILLNTHMDVVPVEPEKWTHDPFEAYKDEQGNIYARGASDMKSAIIGELEAIRRLKQSGFQPLRTIHMTIMPDEELAATRGTVPFVKTKEFENLNVGIDIDEGFPSNSSNLVHINYAEKSIWHFNITAYGEAGHGSTLPKYTAGQRLQVVIDKLLEYRESELQKIEQQNVSIEHVTSLNLVQLGGGIGDNVIPNELWASFDMRVWLEPGWNFTEAENMILNITKAAQLGSEPNLVTLNFIVKSLEAGRTAIDDSNIWWTELQNACQQMNITCEPHVLTAATDGRFIREVGIPVFGFCPFPDTPPTAHKDNEFINELEFLRGIDRYANLIQHISMVSQEANQ